MDRRPLLALLDTFLVRHPEDRATVETVARFVRAHPDCFERSCRPGHVTGSAWIVSPDREAVLLTHHRKLDRWLQLGGHADGDSDVLAVALREAREESGLETLELLPGDDGRIPLDIDVHEIPARGAEPVHQHHDVRFLFVARPGEGLRVSDESHDLRWVPWQEISTLTQEESILRMQRRARARLQRGLRPV
jgi:8-oxo-dGTP pyrophosphatase MutT (NUDIX family)